MINFFGEDKLYTKDDIKNELRMINKDHSEKKHQRKREMDSPKLDSSKLGSKVTSSKLDSPKMKSAKVNSSKLGSKVKSSKVDSSKVDSSKVDSSKVDSFKVESSKVESSKVESSKVESSKVESSKVESSKNELDSNELDSNELDSNELDSIDIDSNDLDSNDLDSNDLESNDLDLTSEKSSSFEFSVEEEVKEEIIFDKIIEINEINELTKRIEKDSGIEDNKQGGNNIKNEKKNEKNIISGFSRKFQVKLGISDLGNRPREGQLDASSIFMIGLMTMLYILLRSKLERICQIYDITDLTPEDKKWLEHQIHIRNYLRNEKSILAKGSFVQEIVDQYENKFNQSEEDSISENELRKGNELRKPKNELQKEKEWIELLKGREVIPDQTYTIHISMDEDFLVQFKHPDFISGVLLVLKWFELTPSEHLFQCHNENCLIEWENLVKN